MILSPLDWGLGHTVRCIPIIQELLAQNCTVVIACNSVQKALLSAEFPDCTYLNLPGYDLRYSAGRWRTIGKIVYQLPNILTRVKEELGWLQQISEERHIDGVISDNRFGFYHASIPSVFITHQLHIKTGLGSIADALVQRINYKRIARFGACWVPDLKGKGAIAGKLSNPRQMPDVPVQYLGGISRLQPCASTFGSKLLIILSGPEPQRTIFENQILKELTVPAVLVRGLPEISTREIPNTSTLTVYNHATASHLNKLICEADVVISRCGYTTIMDLLKLGKKSILVPTPGQAEQEYLAGHLLRQRWAYTVPQKKFSLREALQAARKFDYQLPVLNMEDYKEAVRAFVQNIISTSGNQKTKTPL